MQEHAKKPAIRFKGFTDDWEQRKLGEIGNIITGSTPNTNIRDNYGGNFLFVSPVDIQGNRYVNTTITTLTKKGFKQCRKVKAKSSLFVSIGSTIGKVAQSEKELTTNQQINSLEPYESYDEDYIYTALENIADKVKAIASTQAVPIVNKTTFSEIEIHITNQVEEQKKIGFWFARLDRLVTLHQRKHDKLMNIKKAMLEKMFPQDGAKIPEIRFKGFTDDWEQRKLGEIAERASSKAFSSEDYPSVEYEDIISNSGELNKDIRSKKIRKSGILFDDSNVLYGKLRPYLHNWLNPDFKGVAVGDWWVMQPKAIDKTFLYRLVQTKRFDDVANQSSGSKMPRADWNLVSNSGFMLPPIIEEQLKIADLFTSLDRLITLHQRKLEKLQNIKRACLEKLFV